jgi:hypothetical protein
MKTKNILAVAMAVLLFGSTIGYAFSDSWFWFADSEELSEEEAEELIPETYEETLELIEAEDQESEETMPPYWNTTRRFILWTSDGVNVMWGEYGNGFFVGNDNNGEQAWGIYHKGLFMGFYGDEKFVGRYRGFRWEAEGLFGLEDGQGGLIVFPKFWFNRAPNLQIRAKPWTAGENPGTDCNSTGITGPKLMKIGVKKHRW